MQDTKTVELWTLWTNRTMNLCNTLKRHWNMWNVCIVIGCLCDTQHASATWQHDLAKLLIEVSVQRSSVLSTGVDKLNVLTEKATFRNSGYVVQGTTHLSAILMNSVTIQTGLKM